jgi:Cu+-exporting ATPase
MLALGSVLMVGLLGLYLVLQGVDRGSSSLSSVSNVVTTASGEQIVTIAVKGGYSPQVSTVKAGVPVTLRFTTNGTFDCSSSISIPEFGIAKMLPMSGETDVPLGSLAAGTVEGTCGMGMYRFQIRVEG